jgi:hypothetical protein
MIHEKITMFLLMEVAAIIQPFHSIIPEYIKSRINILLISGQHKLQLSFKLYQGYN